MAARRYLASSRPFKIPRHARFKDAHGPPSATDAVARYFAIAAQAIDHCLADAQLRRDFIDFENRIRSFHAHVSALLQWC